jgi:uncharacterized protein YbjT (DUF2867 family)
MFAITGITGQVGSAVARNLSAHTKNIRAIVRTPEKGAAWAAQGFEVAIADVDDAASMEKAFRGTEGVFVMLPPIFDPAPGFPEAHKTIEALRTALLAARPGRVVALSTIGAHVTTPNLLNQLLEMEQAFSTLPLPIAFLRPGWFMENSTWDIQPARETGIIPSFLQPLDKPFPMVATDDIGAVAAQLLLEKFEGHRIVELEGPQRITPNQVAATFSQLLGRDVRMQIMPRDTWESYFCERGMKTPEPRMQMLDGFNEGWIEFEGGQQNTRKGATTFESVLRSLLQKEAQA